MDNKNIDILYELMEEMRKQGKQKEAAALRWAIFKLEQMEVKKNESSDFD